MKICFYCSGFRSTYGGVEESISALSKLFVKKGHSVIVISGYGPKPTSKQFRILELPFIYRNFLQIFPFIGKLLPLSEFEALSMFPFALFFLFLFRPDITLSNQLAETLPSLILKIPCVMISQSADRSRIRSFKKVDQVIVNDPLSIEKLKKYDINSKFLLNGTEIPDGLQDFPDLNLKFRPNKNSKIILTIARLDKNKRINLLLDAVNAMNNDVSLIIIGEGPELKSLRNHASNLKSKKRIFFLKPMNHEQIQKFLKICDVFSLPSKVEGLPLVLIEALSNGKVVVVNPTPEKKYILGKYGVYTNVEDIDEYSKSLMEACELKIEQNEEFKEYIKKFSWEEISEQYLNVFTEILKNRASKEAA